MSRATSDPSEGGQEASTTIYQAYAPHRSSNVVGFEGRASVERQAREWLIRLDGDDPMSGAEARALHEWMSRNAAHRDELLRISKFWKQANVLTELAVPLRPPNRVDKIVIHFRLGGLFALIGGLLVALSLAWRHFYRTDRAANGTYATAIGRQQTIGDPDLASVPIGGRFSVRDLDAISGCSAHELRNRVAPRQ